MNQAAELIKQQISMSDIFRQYGFQVRRGGFILCPFHSEDTPSLKTYANDTRWKCFGCGRGGTAIDFVMNLFNLSLSQAIVRIDNDFRLGITNQKADSRQIQRLYAERAAKEKEKKEQQARYNHLLKRFSIIDKFLTFNEPTQDTAGEIGALMGERDAIWYQLRAMESEADRR